MKEYDYLIVGAGLFGAVFAYEAGKAGKKCLVIDKREHIGGNVYCEEIEGIQVHKYGAHIFHTNDKEVWDYVNQFTEFNRYTNSPVARYEGRLYNLPFNMNTFYQLWGVRTPKEAKEKLDDQIRLYGVKNPKNLEEQALSLVGRDIYETLIKGYTKKQWGRDPKELPSFIMKRLPLRFTFDNNYFNDKYQGIPIGGYTKMVEQMLAKAEVILQKDYFDDKSYWDEQAEKVVFTGMPDEYFSYCYGELEYRSLRFEEEVLDCENYQGNAVVNYTEYEVPFTRIIEHKHFEFGNQPKTIITREYPFAWVKGEEPYYPVNDEKNNKLFEKYKLLIKKEKQVIFGGRLGEYQYYNMDQVIKRALVCAGEELAN